MSSPALPMLRTRPLQEVLHAAEDDPESLGEMGLNNPSVLANSLHRMRGQAK